MKRILLTLIVSLFAFVANAQGISNYKELLAFAKAANKGMSLAQWQNENGEVCLKADIDMKKGKKFPTISSFNGVFNGCGYKLYNWSGKNGLFDVLETGGVVKNVVIDASCHMDIKMLYNDKTVNIAYIVLQNKGEVIDCVNHGSIEFLGENMNKIIRVAGVVAANSNIIYGCKNTGNINATVRLTTPDKNQYFRVAGIAGECAHKVIAGATITACENSGNITCMSDFPSNNIAGITGEAKTVTIKYCVNRGNVATTSLPDRDGRTRTSGITSWTDASVICCDNYGMIASLGAHESFAAGIVSRPNAALNIVNCINRGKVFASVARKSYVGGIAAFTIRDVRVANCFNYGEISAEGLTQPNWVGGIIGLFNTTAKGLKFAAYIRECVNYGKITNKSNHKWSAVGGILGEGSGYKKDKIILKMTVSNCKNYGQLISANSRKGDILGASKEVAHRKNFYDCIAREAKPLKDGSNIFGRVVDTEGMPVAGAVVSDGLQSVLTDVNGEYKMKSNMAQVSFVQVSIPAKYEIPLYDNRPVLFARVLRGMVGARATFVLKKRENPNEGYTFAMVGDPQMKGFKQEGSAEAFRNVVMADLATLQEAEAAKGNRLYAINLGDITYDNMWAYDNYVDIIAKGTVPMFSVWGNHDTDRNTLYKTEYATPYFESYLSPVNYSFNIGKMHFVVVNNIIHNRQNLNESYSLGLEDSTYQWLRNDLKYVPTDHTIVFCGHAQIFKDSDLSFPSNLTLYHKDENYVNFDKYSDLLSRYSKVYSWAGHLHQNYSFNYNGASEEYSKLSNIEAITVGRSIGQLWVNKELNVDGTPNGYVVAELKDDNMEWYYKSIGNGREKQMRLYSPKRTNSGFVKALVWNYSPDTWSCAEWWENGVKVADMEHIVNEYDPDYMAFHGKYIEGKVQKTSVELSKPVKTPYLFRVTPSEGVTSGEVRITDKFGVTYIEKIEW